MEDLLERHPWAVPTGIYALAAVLGLVVLVENRDNPFFVNLISDDRQYLIWATDLASGKGFGPRPFFISPLYLFFLAALAKVGITAPAAIRMVQVLVGSLVYPLVYGLGSRLLGRASGLVAAALALGYGTLLFLPADISPPWMEALLLLALALLVTGEPRSGRLAAAGLTGGLLALSRPTILLFALLYPLLLLLRDAGQGRGGAPRRARIAGIFLAAFFLPILPVTIRNAVVGHDFVLTSSHGGINFYIGNSPEAPGRLYAPDGLTPGLESLNDTDAQRVAETALGRRLAPSDISRYWFRRGLRFLVEQPGAAAALYARKIVLFLHSYEVSTNSDYYLFRDRSLVLGLLRIPFAFLLATGAVGLYLTRGHRELGPLRLLMALQVLTPVVFFAAFRFRAPLAPLLAVPAGYALAQIVRRTGQARRALLPALAAAFGAALLLGYPYPLVREMDLDSRASFTENLGLQFVRQEQIPAAERAFRAAIALRPAIQNSHWHLAQILESRGDAAGALAEWKLAAELFGPNSEWGQKAFIRYQLLKRQLERH